MEKAKQWAKAHKKSLLIGGVSLLVLLIVGAIVYYYRDRIMPSPGSDIASTGQDSSVSGKQTGETIQQPAIVKPKIVNNQQIRVAQKPANQSNMGLIKRMEVSQ